MVSGTVDISSKAAFSLRKDHFPDEIHFFAPGLKRYCTEEFQQVNPRAFLSISLTGSSCALQCDHCEARILESMLPVPSRESLFDLCSRLVKKGTRGVLISGGSSPITGGVPLQKYLVDIGRMKTELGLRVMVHTGLVNEATAKGLSEAGVDGVMMDVIGADETIRDVYHMEFAVRDFDRSLDLLCKHGLSVRPHIILGLHYGKILGEYNALELIAKYPVHALVLVVITPLMGTAMQDVKPPEIPELQTFFHMARQRMPRTAIMVGCSRPAGEHKEALDRAAIDFGLNGIAYPAEGIVEYARSKGLKPHFYEDSCSCGYG